MVRMAASAPHNYIQLHYITLYQIILLFNLAPCSSAVTLYVWICTYDITYSITVTV
jgi:hypothetical protein